MKSIDSIRRPAQRPTPPAQTPRAETTGTGARFTKFQRTKKRRSIPWSFIISIIASPVLCGLALVGMIGVGVVALYGVAALLWRIPSRNTFALALAALLYMVGAQLAASKDMAQALALLAYVLLAIGAISLAREVKSASNVWFKKH